MINVVDFRSKKQNNTPPPKQPIKPEVVIFMGKQFSYIDIRHSSLAGFVGIGVSPF